jgi:hypothetical protein
MTDDQPSAAEPFAAPDDRQQQRAQAELLDRARKQLAAVTQEFQRGLQSVTNSKRRQELTTGYVNVLQRYLVMAQQGLERYQSKRQPAATTEPGTDVREP